MILSHHTHIHMGGCTVVNGVYKQISYDLVTLDISMKFEKDPKVWTNHILDLPDPDPDNFIPFEKVDERVILKWIADNEPRMVQWQYEQTAQLMKKIAHDRFTG